MQNTDWLRAPIGIVGAGRVGGTLARFLCERGEPLEWIASRTMESARAAAMSAGAGVRAIDFERIGGGPWRVLIAVPDGALESVATALPLTGGIALHTCGARGAEALASLAAHGVSCGALHPLQTFAAPAGPPSLLDGAAFAVAGDGAALAWAENIAALAGGRVLRIRPELRPLYHAAAVLASNCVVSLVEAAASVMQAAGAEPGDILPALAPLARTSLENALRLGPARALTGPVQRGDTGTVAAQWAALEGAPEAVRMLYRAGAWQALAIADAQGLAAEKAAAIRETLT